MRERADKRDKYREVTFDEPIEDDYRSKLEETERLKAFRVRKQKEMKRRKRNRAIRRFVLILAAAAVIAGGIYYAAGSHFPELSGLWPFGEEKESQGAVGEGVTTGAAITTAEAPQEEPETETFAAEETAKEPAAEESISEESISEESIAEESTDGEPETEPSDPREDVWEHYQNMFIVANTKNYLNVRDQPSQDGIIIGKLVKYAGGELLEDLGNGWFHILSGGIDGYVSSEYCLTGEEAKQLALGHCFEMVEVTAERLNVRSGPGESYEAWAQLNASEKQVVVGQEGDWLKIAINSTYGYISKEFTVQGYYLVEAMPWSSISNYSETRQALFDYAEQFIGTKYVFGGTDLWGGIDCSSYVQQCFKNAIGIQLPRTSRQQATVGTQITLAEAKPGDLLFYADEAGVIDHVAMYLGDGKILHSAQSLGQVIISKYNYATEPVQVRNIIGD